MTATKLKQNRIDKSSACRGNQSKIELLITQLSKPLTKREKNASILLSMLFLASYFVSLYYAY